MKRARNLLTRIATLCVALVVTLAATTNVLADKLHLKDGRVVEGSITSEGDDYLYFKSKVGGIDKTDFYAKSDIKKIERDSVTNPAPTPGTEPKASGNT